MTLTKELVDACRTDGGSFTVEAARMLGAKMPLVRGWAKALIGTEISETDYKAAKLARNVHPVGEPWSYRSPGQLGLNLDL